MENRAELMEEQEYGQSAKEVLMEAADSFRVHEQPIDEARALALTGDSNDRERAVMLLQTETHSENLLERATALKELGELTSDATLLHESRQTFIRAMESAPEDPETNAFAVEGLIGIDRGLRRDEMEVLKKEMKTGEKMRNADEAWKFYASSYLKKFYQSYEGAASKQLDFALKHARRYPTFEERSEHLTFLKDFLDETTLRRVREQFDREAERAEEENDLLSEARAHLQRYRLTGDVEYQTAAASAYRDVLSRVRKREQDWKLENAEEAYRAFLELLADRED